MNTALQQITDRIRAAVADATPLRLRGGGTKDFYGQALQGEVLDTTSLRGITSYEPSELVVTVQAGTPLLELEEALAEKGQMLPFEPPHFAQQGARATVGGMVAAGLSGPARGSVGAVRDYVLGASVVNGRAEHLTFGGQVMKNVAGYDVSRLMAGSLGTLALITEVSLKVLPLAPAETTLEMALDEANALAQLNRWGAQPLPVNASCWHDGVLRVRLRGARAAVSAAIHSMGGTVMDDASARQFWSSLREQTASFFQTRPGEALVRLGVPDTAPPLNLGPTLIEWGGAQRWIKLAQPARAELSARLSQFAGHATIFRAPDKAAGAFTPLSPALERIHRQLKQQFDPQGIFNRGRLYADL